MQTSKFDSYEYANCLKSTKSSLIAISNILLGLCFILCLVVFANSMPLAATAALQL